MRRWLVPVIRFVIFSCPAEEPSELLVQRIDTSQVRDLRHVVPEPQLHGDARRRSEGQVGHACLARPRDEPSLGLGVGDIPRQPGDRNPHGDGREEGALSYDRERKAFVVCDDPPTAIENPSFFEGHEEQQP